MKTRALISKRKFFFTFIFMLLFALNHFTVFSQNYPLPPCPPTNLCDNANIYCYGSFNAFTPTSQNGLDYFQQSGETNCQPYGLGFVNKTLITNNSGSNAVSIFSTDNDGINQGGHQTKGVFILKLSDPIKPGCKLKLKFKAGFIAYDGRLSVFVSNANLCNTTPNPSCPDNPTGVGIFHCLMSDQLINTNSGTNYSINYINQSTEDLNYISFTSKISLNELYQFESHIFIDDIDARRECNEICVTSNASMPCIGEQMTIDYTFCNIGDVVGGQNINVQASLSPSNAGITFVNNADFTTGTGFIQNLIANGPCITKKLILNIASNVAPGTAFSIQISGSGPLSCLGNCSGNLLNFIAKPCPIVCPCNTVYNIEGAPDINLNQTNLPPNIFNGPCMSVKGNLIISSNYTFNGGEIRMEPGSSISIINGATVRFINVNQNGGIHGCDKMWKGIDVETDASIEFTNNIISDAENAIHAYNKTHLINFTANKFKHNVFGLYLDHGNSVFNAGEGAVILEGSSEIAGNEFSCNTGGATCVLLPDYPGQTPHKNSTWAGIKASNMTVTIGNNLFVGLRFGILSVSSVMNIHNSSFDKIWPVTYPADNKLLYSEGDGISGSESWLTINNCTFTHSYKGIEGTRSAFTTSYNTMTDVVHGIYNYQCNGISNHTHEDIQYAGYGILIDKWPSTFAAPKLIIRNNSLHAISPNIWGVPVSAIRLLDLSFVQQSNVGFVENNIISTHLRSEGIGIWNTNHIQVKANIIDFTLTDGLSSNVLFKSGKGIYLANAANCLIKSNNITVWADPYYIGISDGILSSISPQNRYCCNYIYNKYNSIRFIGANNSDFVRHNSINYHTYGLRLDESIIGNQQPFPQAFGLSGNSWNVNANTGGYNAYNNNSINNNGLNSKIIVNTCNTPLWPSSIFPVQNCPGGANTWFQELTGFQVNSCSSDALCKDLVATFVHLSTDSIISEADNYIGRGEYNHPDFGTAFNFDAQLELYTRIKNNSYLIGQSASVDSFYNANLSTNINNVYEIRLAERQINHFPSAYQTILNTFSTGYEQTQTDFNHIIAQMGVTHGTPQFALYLDSLNMLTQSTSLLLAQVNPTIKKIQQWQEDRIQEAEWKLQSYLPLNVVESNYQLVQLYKLKSMKQDFVSFSNIEMDNINTIADACLLSNASPVIGARCLRTAWDLPDYEDYDNCVIEQRAGKVVNNTESPIKMILQPNPAKDFVDISLLNAKTSIIADINIYNVSGYQVVKKSLAKNGVVRISTNQLPNGIYFVKCLITDDGTTLIQKLIISK